MTTRQWTAATGTVAALAFLITGCNDEGPLGVQESVAATTASLLAPQATPAGATRTGFQGLYFPAGMPDTGTDCPFTWQAPAFCVVDLGSWTELPGGRWKIRDMTVYELAFSWRSDGAVEPRKTGYDVVVAHANLDGTLTGPTWGTWNLYSFDDELMFGGTFTGSFQNGIPAVHFVGEGVGAFEGQHMRGDIARTPDEAGYNMYGVIVEPGGL